MRIGHLSPIEVDVLVEENIGIVMPVWLFNQGHGMKHDGERKRYIAFTASNRRMLEQVLEFMDLLMLKERNLILIYKVFCHDPLFLTLFDSSRFVMHLS
jgi:hypothetical protein